MTGGRAHRAATSLRARRLRLECVLALLAMQQHVALPTMHLEQPDVDCDLDYVANLARPGAAGNVMLSNSFAFGGTNAVLALRSPERGSGNGRVTSAGSRASVHGHRYATWPSSRSSAIETGHHGHHEQCRHGPSQRMQERREDRHHEDEVVQAPAVQDACPANVRPATYGTSWRR